MAQAYTELLNDNTDKHDQIVKAGLLTALQDSDVIILTQASMARVLQSLDKKPTIPILTSPQSGIYWLQKKLQTIK